MDINIPFPEAQEFNLPSNGMCGFKSLLIRPITMEDEELIGNKSIAKTGRVHEAIFERCVMGALSKDNTTLSKSEFNLGDIYTEDELAALIFLRAISYGRLYEGEMNCPVCDSVHKFKIDLETELEIKYAKEGTPSILEVFLPNIKRKAVIHYPKKKEALNLKNPMHIIPKIIESIEGVDKTVLDLTIKKLIGMDAATIREAVEKRPFGIQKTIKFACTNSECDKAGDTQEVPLPITPEFFRW